MHALQRLRTASRFTLVVTLLAVLGLIAGAFGAINLAFAAQAGPPTPTITSGPSGTVATTSATFTYSDTQAGVTFSCALDNGNFTTCANSGTTYTGLTNGAHTFKVQAKSGNATSSAASRQWTVDTTPPTLALAFPANNGSYNAALWNAGCAGGPGICGSASDPSGVGSARVSIQQASSGKWWNGLAFTSSTEVFNAATGTTTWRYPLAAPATGAYAVHVRATDGVGNATVAAGQLAATFNIDTTAPPVPTITNAPDDPTFSDKASFGYTDTEAGVTFECSLDGSSFASCPASGKSYNKLDTIDHCFDVRAVDPAGNAGTPAEYCWSVLVKFEFGIRGDLGGPLYPGASQLLNLVFKNPSRRDLKITDVAISVNAATNKLGCSGVQNLLVTRGFTGPVTVPRLATKSLSDLGVPLGQWPILTMPNLSTNQDACRGATFTFSFSGSAVKG
jgi:hypothetical protein